MLDYWRKPELMMEPARLYIEKSGIKFNQLRLAKIFTGLDFYRYEILRIIPKGDRCAVIVQRCVEQDNPHYCVQYGGGGKYFSTWPEVVQYYKRRWHDNKLDGLDGTNSDFDSGMMAPYL
ncbi:MAG: hypothetical protein LUE29_08125 [Lachnospiraceae bacterium]|nr:hypothetical protein [Lachnospiraceae bacterium]